MYKEIKLFFTALRFYTRIPCPQWEDYVDEDLSKATRYFPLVGWIVGGIIALSAYGLHFIFPATVCIILALIVGVLTTGAFHEDGFADVCDGFGGGWSKMKILEIMKDSRIGVYGALGLILLFALKILVLVELFNIDILLTIKVILLAHVVSRFSVVSLVYTNKYAREDGSSKVKPIEKGTSGSALLIGVIWLLPFLWLFQNNYLYLLAILPVYLTKICLSHYFTRWIGGYTGDCLGATQQVTEMVTFLFCLGLYKFI